MYVFCVGMYRSCSTWQYDVAAHMLERHRGCRRLGYLTGLEFDRLDRREPPGADWPILKSHEVSLAIARKLRRGKGRALYAHRDLRDVVYSMLHKRGWTFDRFLAAGNLHQILANDRFWRSRPGVMTQSYDDLIRDPEAGVRQIAAFLEIGLAEGEAAAIAAEYSREANKARTERFRDQLVAQGIDPTDPANRLACDPHSLLHWDHVRGPSAPTWRQLATPRERLILARLCGDWLIANGYERDDSWAREGSREPIAGRWRLHAGVSLALGRARFHGGLQQLSFRYPRTSATVKRCLGMAPPASAGGGE